MKSSEGVHRQAQRNWIQRLGGLSVFPVLNPARQFWSRHVAAAHFSSISGEQERILVQCAMFWPIRELPEGLGLSLLIQVSVPSST